MSPLIEKHSYLSRLSLQFAWEVLTLFENVQTLFGSCFLLWMKKFTIFAHLRKLIQSEWQMTKRTFILYISYENVPGIVNDYFFWKITLFGYLTSFVHQHRVMESNLKSGNSTLTTCKFQNYRQCFQKIAPVYSNNLCVCVYN